MKILQVTFVVAGGGLPDPETLLTSYAFGEATFIMSAPATRTWNSLPHAAD